MRKVLLAACGAAGWLVIMTAPAVALDLPPIVISERIPEIGHMEPGFPRGRTAPGSVHLVSTTNVDPALDGGTCDVTVTGENNTSVHPNSDILIASANQVTVPDVERSAGAQGIPADGALELGSTVTISVRLGGDGVFSGGLLQVDFTCTPPGPPPSVTPQSVATTSTTASPNAPVVAAESQQKPPTGSTTLPRTGSDTTGPLVAGLASLVVGAGLLAKVAVGARRERGEAARTS